MSDQDRLDAMMNYLSTHGPAYNPPSRKRQIVQTLSIYSACVGLMIACGAVMDKRFNDRPVAPTETE